MCRHLFMPCHPVALLWLGLGFFLHNAVRFTKSWLATASALVYASNVEKVPIRVHVVQLSLIQCYLTSIQFWV